MERVTTLLTQARAAGLMVRTDGERLIVRGPKQQSHLATVLLNHKAEVLALLSTDEQAILNRMAALRPLVPAIGPIPFLLVRPQLEVPSGQCLSCGEALSPEDLYRCRLCVEAVRRVLAEVETERHRLGGVS